MDISQKITLLNQSTLEALEEVDKLIIVKNFTSTGLKIFDADFSFTFWKQEKNKQYRLLYKTSNTPYKPNLPRPGGFNSRVEKSKKPYMGVLKKEKIAKYDLTPYMKSIVILPIVYKNHIYGNLVLCFKKKRIFTKEERSLATALGNALAQSITISRLNQNLQEIKHTLDHTPQPKIIFDPATRIISYYNKSLLSQTGLNKSRLNYATIENIIHPSYSKVFQKRLKHIIAEKIPSSIFETTLLGPGKRKLPVEILLQYVSQPDQQPHLLAIIQDLRERKKREEQIKRAAFHDTLTGLPNRFLFTKKLSGLINVSMQKHRLFALIFVDLDRFKFINDTLGHIIGDELLRQVAVRLKRNVKRSDTVSRFGGDEFVILLGNLHSSRQIDRVIRRVKNAFETPFKLSSHQEVYVNFSMGISIFPRDGTNDVSLLKNADNALYRAKQEGGNSYQYYEAELITPQQSRLEIEKELRRAVSKKELFLQYQPIIDLKTGKIKTVEALARWDHPKLGTISPEIFIPYAEESGLILPLGRWVFGESCRQLKIWRKAGLTISMSVNVSARELLEKNTIQKMQQTVRRFKLSPKDITLEVTETFLIKNMESFTKILSQLKKLGFKTSLDDFGTGYASLNYLKSLPVDYIKIDRLFIQGLNNGHDAGIVKAIIMVAHHLGIKVIAEGVEDKQQAGFLKGRKCDWVQGNFYSPPLPVKEIFEISKKRFN